MFINDVSCITWKQANDVKPNWRGAPEQDIEIIKWSIIYNSDTFRKIVKEITNEDHIPRPDNYIKNIEKTP